MNTKIEEIKRITDSFDKLTDKERETLNAYLLQNIDAFSNDPIGIVKSGFKYLAEQLVYQFIQETNIRSESANNIMQGNENEEGYARTINDSQRVERGKAFVETMSSQARAYDELMQQRRNERYEEMNIDKIIDKDKYEQIKSRQQELETQIKKSSEQLPIEAKYSIIKLREYKRMMATQVNPKVLTDESLINAKYIQELEHLLYRPIQEQSALSMQAMTLGHNLTSREQAYIDYSNLLYSSKIEDLPFVYAMFYAEFPIEDFGKYAKAKLDEMRQEENQPPKML